MSDREARLRRLLEVGVEVEPAQLASRLHELDDDPELVAEALALITGEAALGGFLAAPALAALDGQSILEPPDDSQWPAIPGFEITRVLGEGGMGKVYLARQREPVERLVAIKTVRAALASSSLTQRFLAEQQALARLNHPAIAQLYAASTTADGQPYATMEYVDGLPITDYCDREQASIEDRLRLFISVCHGVDHAHRRQLLHRDLKPSNILVTTADGKLRPKIIDFGIARILDAPMGTADATNAMVLGTPDYMSPEALAPTDGVRDLDTRTDVYSLGVVLYELLAGNRPYAQRTPSLGAAMERLATDPVRPSTRVGELGREARVSIAANRCHAAGTLAGRLRGDLDWITLKALAIDRDDRYRSPGELGDDIQRSLDDEPISARPPNLVDQVRRLVRRHRTASMFAAAALVAIVAAAVVTSLALVRTIRAEEAAVAESTAARQTLDFLVSLFEGASPEVVGSESLSARDLVERGVASVADQELEPTQRARLLHTLADVQFRLANYTSGLELAEAALSLRKATLSPNHPDLLATHELVGNLERRLGRFDRAEPHLELVLAEAERHPENPLEIANSLNSLANLRWRQGRLEEAEALNRRSLDLREVALPEHPEIAADVAASHNNLGVQLNAMRRWSEAEPHLRRAVELFESSLGVHHPRIAVALGNLGISARNQQRFDEDEQLQRRALSILEQAYGTGHPDTAGALNNLALALAAIGEFGEAEELYRRSLEIYDRTVGRGHPEAQRTLTNLVVLYVYADRLEEATQVARELLAIRTAAPDPTGSRTAFAQSMLAGVLTKAGQFEEAEALLDQALPIHRRDAEEQPADLERTLQRLGALARHQHNLRLAREYLEEARRAGDRSNSPSPRTRADTLCELGAVARDEGHLDEAQELFELGLETRRAVLPNEHPEVQSVLSALAELGRRQAPTP